MEPFAGGASASLKLVGDGVVDRVLLADADPLVAAFWQEAAASTSKLIDRMWDEYRRFVVPGGSKAVERWDYWKTWVPSNKSEATVRHETAVRCLFLNRTTFSGILHGSAGPIGGRSQISENTIGCRWNPDDLAQRLGYVGRLYETGQLVDVWCKTWDDTLDTVPEHYPQLLPSRVVAYLDPPYIDKSPKLYHARSTRVATIPGSQFGISLRGPAGALPAGRVPAAPCAVPLDPLLRRTPGATAGSRPLSSGSHGPHGRGRRAPRGEALANLETTGYLPLLGISTTPRHY